MAMLVITRGYTILDSRIYMRNQDWIEMFGWLSSRIFLGCGILTFSEMWRCMNWTSQLITLLRWFEISPYTNHHSLTVGLKSHRSQLQKCPCRSKLAIREIQSLRPHLGIAMYSHKTRIMTFAPIVFNDLTGEKSATSHCHNIGVPPQFFGQTQIRIGYRL